LLLLLLFVFAAVLHFAKRTALSINLSNFPLSTAANAATIATNTARTFMAFPAITASSPSEFAPTSITPTGNPCMMSFSSAMEARPALAT
jgi:hypothetical protein